MPKKKKNGHSALAGQSGENVSAHFNPGPSGATAGTRALSGPTMSELGLQSRNEIVGSMHDMFSHLDPDVIYIVLSEADFKVENAMDALLELSGAAVGKCATSPSRSGFEMAAALLDPWPSNTHSSTIRSVDCAVSRSAKSPQEFAAGAHLTEEFDSLIDHELESLAACQPQPSSITRSIFPLSSESLPIAQEALTDLDQLDVGSASKSGFVNDQSSNSTAKMSGAKRTASPVNELSYGGVPLPQETGISVDFSHLTNDSTSAAQRPSVFKAYHRPGEYLEQISAPVPHTGPPQTNLHTFWNIDAPDFTPGFEAPAFITPVVQAPNAWTTIPTPYTQWMPSRPGSEALKPSVTVPKSWIFFPQSRLKLEGQVLVLLRGAPGSGKTTLASAMFEQNPGGIVLCTDEYFTRNGTYHYEPHLLGEAHAWNHRRAKEAFEKGLTPIIIDNTNLQCWEMKPYVALALKHNYRVLFREPNTWWKSKARELEKRTRHGVTKEKIRRMLENQDRYVSVQNIMTSQPKPTAVYGVDVCQTDATERPLVSCLDLVGDRGLGKPGRYRSSSLPDVSSVDCKDSSTLANADAAENLESHGSKEYVSFPEDFTERTEAIQPELVDGTDMELDVCMTRTVEQPVICAESIGQRVKRVREQTRTEDGDVSTLNCDSLRTASQDVGVNMNTEKLEFVGDWPSESLEQRRQRSRKSASQTSENSSEDMSNFKEGAKESGDTFVGHFHSDPTNKTEFQKFVDVLQGDDPQITQYTSVDFQYLSEDRNRSGLVTKSQPILPDCVLDGTPEISSDPEKGNCHTRILGLESGQEKKKVSSRKAGKSCKLALTFLHQSPSSSPSTGFLTNPLQQSELNTSPVIRVTPVACPSVSAQTESQYFALLWRINQQKCSEQELESGTGGTILLDGNPLRFVPKRNEEKPPEQHVIPYRVCHEKGSQVKENDLAELPFKHHSLEIIRRHFKHVPKETLEDLYEKCSQDIDWTTNLLLDSGEHFSKDDEEIQFDFQHVEGLVQGAVEGSVQGAKEGSCGRQLTMETTENYTKDMVIEEAGSNHRENAAFILPNNTNSTMSIVESGPEVNQLLESEESNQMDHANEPVGAHEALNHASELLVEFEVFETYPHGEPEDKVVKDGEIQVDFQTVMRSQCEEMGVIKEELRVEKEKEKKWQRKNGPMDIQTLELKLTTELALQLTELFGPVGISPVEFTSENCSVLMDLKVAKLLHQKWKDTIQEKHRQAALSYLLQEGSLHWGESQAGAAVADFLIGIDASLGSQSGFQEGIPFMDHWNVSRPPVSLRDIMLEEQVLQDSMEKSRVSRWDLDKKDGAAVVKEKQLFALFPTIDRHFLRDIFRDYNYSLEQTEQFLHALTDDEPVRTVVASESVLENNEKSRATSKERKQKNEMVSTQFQDIEDPEYEDFRTEAILQKRRQQECFNKAAEAYRQGHKEVASFYAQQGHLHGQKTKEANHRAAVQIFERVNATLLPQNILDLHGLHVNEALQHLQQILAKKASEWQQGLCRPQLSVITGRGNRSQGGVARIRPAVIDYLESQHYKFTEPKMGLVIVMLHRAD